VSVRAGRGGGCTPCSVGAGGSGGCTPSAQLEQMGGGMGKGTPQFLENEKNSGNDW